MNIASEVVGDKHQILPVWTKPLVLRVLQTLLVVLFFAVMMGLLFRDHVIPSMTRGSGIEVDRAVLTDSWVDQNEWMVIKLGDANLGVLRSTAEAEYPEGYRRPAVRFNRPAMGSTAEAYTITNHLELSAAMIKGRVLSVARLNRRLELDSIRVRAQIGTLGQQILEAEALDAEELPPGVYELTAVMDGANMLVRIRRDDTVRFEQVRVARPITMADSITPILRGQMLSQNVVYAVDVFDPFLGANTGKAEIEWVDSRNMEVDAVGQNVKLVDIRFGTMKTRLFVDQVGTVFRREIPLFATAADPNAPQAPGSIVAMERVAPEDAPNRFPKLVYTAIHRPIPIESMRGTNQGDVLAGLSLFSMLSGGAMRSSTTGTKP